MNDDIKPTSAGAKKGLAKIPPDPKEPKFEIPEAIAAKDEATDSVKSKSLPKTPKKFSVHLSRKQLLMVSVGIVVLVIGITAWLVLGRSKPAPPPAPVAQIEPVPVPPPAPTTVASRLTGLQISPELNDLPSTGVMIENSPDARPQAGLIDAGVVFEAIAEGGITRFLAIFQEGKPGHLGPVRSVRPYYLDFLVPFDAPIAHAGGSGEALAQIKAQGIKDLDHGANGSTYSRVSNRFAPHNLYTSRDRLLTTQTQRGWGTSTYTGFDRKTDTTPTVGASAKVIDLAISSFNYQVKYEWDPTNSVYKRTLAGKPHVDERSGTQLTPKVVVTLVVPFSQNGVYSIYNLSAGGKAYFFQDGVVVEGTWSKAGRTSQFQFKGPDGNTFGLAPGQTWVNIVKTADQVKITP